MNGVHKVIKILAICFAIFIIMNIVGGIIFGISLFTNIEFLNNKVVVKEFEEKYQNVNNITIDVISTNLVIKAGNEFKVEANDLKSKFTSKVINGNLKIEEIKSWFLSGNVAGTITVYVPQEIAKLKIDAGAGRIQINQITTSDFDISQGAGSLTITDSKFGRSDIDGGAGEIKIYNSELNNVKLDAGVGKIDIESRITGNSKIECGIGEMNITLLGKQEDYRINAEKGIGSLKINNQEQKVDNMNYGIGDNVIKIDGGIGAINISYKDILVF